MKKITLLLIILVGISLTACFGPASTGTSTNNGTQQPSSELKSFDNGEFFLTFPANWDVIQPKNFTSDVPDETQVVIRNNIKNETFTATATVVKNKLSDESTTTDYAQQIMNAQRESLLAFKELSMNRQQMTIGLSTVETFVFEYEAKLNANDPALRFVETFAVKNGYAYIILGATSLQEQSNVVNSIGNIVKSFKLK